MFKGVKKNIEFGYGTPEVQSNCEPLIWLGFTTDYLSKALCLKE
jgi:hypothetical protein